MSKKKILAWAVLVALAIGCASALALNFGFVFLGVGAVLLIGLVLFSVIISWALNEVMA